MAVASGGLKCVKDLTVNCIAKTLTQLIILVLIVWSKLFLSINLALMSQKNDMR